MRRLLLIIAVAFLLAIAGCTDAGDDDPTEEIEEPADSADPAESDDEDGIDDESTAVHDSDDDDAADDKDPPDSETEESADLDESSGDDSGTDVEEMDEEETDEEETDEETDDVETDDEEKEQVAAEGELELHAINVGQADATLLVGPTGETMLIDSGDWRDDGETVLAYLESRGIERLDHLVSTHGHADHIGGHAAVIEAFETEKDGVGQVWDSGVIHTTQTYERYLDAVEEYDVTLFETHDGDEIPMEGLNVTVLNPPADSERPSDLHYNSVSVLVEHGDIGFIATGDAEHDVEERLVAEYGPDLEAEIYHAGHHGSATSSTDEFLDVVDPDVSIISSAYDSQFGHPDEEVLNRLTDREIGAVWTGVHGSVLVTSNGTSYSVMAQADATTIPALLRDEPEITVDPVETPTYELDPTDFDDDTEEEGTEDDDTEEDETDEDETEDDETEDDETEEEETENDSDDETDDSETDAESNLQLDPATAGSTAEHTWSYDDLAFSGEIDQITVEYPDGTSLDGLTDADVTVTMTRSMSDGTDTSEININQGSYSGTSATFDLDGRYNTDIVGFVEVVIDGVENPPAGSYTATITFTGADDDVAKTAEFTTE